ncbi:MAG: DUF4393 domain-containing protein [Desulfobacula sp.]|nr:DUF4393 domain-containing protein [Desulfobacula sp.]
MTEELKAATEIAKTTGKAIDAIRDFGGWFSQFVEYPAEQASGIIGDTLKYIHWKIQVAFQNRVGRRMKDRGLVVPTQPIPLKIAIPLVQAATIEDDDNLQELWANLLVNSADKDSGVEVKRIFISILQDLTYFDAQILDKIYSVSLGRNDNVWTYGLPDKIQTFEPEAYKKGDVERLLPNEDVALSLEVLNRLGLIEPLAFIEGGGPIKGVHQTVLGHKFYDACTDKNKV